MSELLSKTREICRLFEIKPSRFKGQNFLINEKIYDEIVKAADLKATDTVLEVGPGLGFLTAKLAVSAREVLAVELDNRLADYLKTGIAAQDIENVKIINEDILRFNPHQITSQYKIVANLPYNISAIFLRQFLSTSHKPESLVLMLQKEVAERIAAAPPAMSLLAISVQHYASPQILRVVKAGNFWPEPSVDSAVIKLNVRPPKYMEADDKLFFRLVRVGFSAKRKMLKNNLVAGLKIDPASLEKLLIKNNLNPKIRAEDLNLEDWYKLFAALAEFMV